VLLVDGTLDRTSYVLLVDGTLDMTSYLLLVDGTLPQLHVTGYSLLLLLKNRNNFTYPVLSSQSQLCIV